MVEWLAPILGVVVVGVIIELVTKEGRMGKFIRAIYAFFVLFVIVQPLPKLLSKLDFWHQDYQVPVNADLVDAINQTSQQAKIQQCLSNLGYPNALVMIQNGVVYINLGQSVSTAEIAKIKNQLGEQEVYIV